MKTKKWLTFILSLLSMLCMSIAVACGTPSNFSSSSSSSSSSSGNSNVGQSSEPRIEYGYSYDENGLRYASVSRAYGKGEFIIADTVEGYPVKEILDWAFSRTEATSVKIPDTVTKIATNAFNDCDTLKRVNIPRDLTVIEDRAFYNCDGLTNIQYNATQCNSPEEGNEIFAWAGSKTDGINLTIGANVEKLPRYLFQGFEAAVTLTFEEGSVCEDVPLYTFRMEIVGTTTVPATILGAPGMHFGSAVVINGGTEIPDNAFENITHIRSVTIPDTVTSIGNYAFKGVWGLNRVDMPDTITDIGVNAFEDCRGLTEIELPNGLVAVRQETFKGCTSLTGMVIPENVTGIGPGAFEGCANLTEFVISENLLYANASAFVGCEKLQFAQYGNCKYLGTANNPYHLLLVASDATSTSYQVHANTKSIANNAFANCTALTDIEIPESVRVIGDNAFSRCTALTSIQIPASIEYIGDGILDGCNQLKKVYYTGTLAEWCNISFRGALQSLGAHLYIQNQLLVNLVIPEGITVVNAYAFANCTSLQTVEIGNQVTAITHNAFNGCVNLTSVTLGDNVASIDVNVFANCPNLQLTEYDNGKYLGNAANPYLVLMVATRNTITSCTIHNDTKVIAGGAFAETRLTEIVIPDNVTIIGGSAFYNCEKLTLAVIGDGVTTIGGDAFRNCENLKRLDLGASLIEIGGSACYNCENLTLITFNGTTAQWREVDRDSSWRYRIPSWVTVLCTDGEGSLNG